MATVAGVRRTASASHRRQARDRTTAPESRSPRTRDRRRGAFRAGAAFARPRSGTRPAFGRTAGRAGRRTGADARRERNNRSRPPTHGSSVGPALPGTREEDDRDHHDDHSDRGREAEPADEAVAGSLAERRQPLRPTQIPPDPGPAERPVRLRRRLGRRHVRTWRGAARPITCTRTSSTCGLSPWSHSAISPWRGSTESPSSTAVAGCS